MGSNEEAFERERLVEVVDAARVQLTAAEKELSGQKSQVIEERRTMWDDSTHVIREFDDIATLAQYDQQVSLQEESFHIIRKKAVLLARLVNSPYFGRIDFEADDEDWTESVYIGVGSLEKPGSYELYVYDWRAPIASMFYDYDIGKAAYDCPAGRISGNLTLKRQYKISNGQMDYMFDTFTKIDDEILSRVLASESESRLKVIISSIQKEQNYAIRYRDHKNIAVFGPAGSGKTSVGLHRLAYLLYHSDGKIASDNMLVISNNNIYNSYIADIIPELGERDINRITFGQLTDSYAPAGYSLPGYFEQAEYVLASGSGDLRARGIGIKYSIEFLDYMKKFFNSFEFAFSNITVRDTLLFSKETLSAYSKNTGTALSFAQNLKRLLLYVEEGIDEFYQSNEDEIKKELMTSSDENLFDDETDMLFRSEWTRTRNAARDKILSANRLTALKIYKELLKSFMRENNQDPGIYLRTKNSMDSGVLYFEDFLAVVCVKILLGEVRPIRGITHVLLDEAQDFTVLQHFIITFLCADCHYTLLADTNQAIFPSMSVPQREILLSFYSTSTKVIDLHKSYRSTGPINALAACVLKNTSIEYFNRDGSPPVLIRTGNNGEAIRKLLEQLDDKSGSVCVLTKTKKQADELYAHLKHHIKLRPVINPEDELTPGITISPVALTKGLEFDHVIIADCSDAQFHTQNDRLILYFMCTRALHRLYLVCQGEATAFLQGSTVEETQTT